MTDVIEVRIFIHSFFFSAFSDVLVLNDIINQTVGTPEAGPVPQNMLEPQPQPLSTLVVARHNSVQSSAAGSATAAALAR